MPVAGRHLPPVTGMPPGRTVFQSVRGLPQQPVLAGRYRNRFERHRGTWRFTELNATTTWSAG